MRKALLIAALLSVAGAMQAQIFINEICPANADINYDTDFYNFSGWVELYNAGASSVNIGGYYLSDKESEPSKWRIPNGTSVPSKGYLLIWCDDMNLRLHTNFNLDPDGEDVILTSGAGVVIDKVTFLEQYTNVSYGRTSDGGATWSYLVTPTPKAMNSGQQGSEALTAPVFSLPAGRYSGTQSVALVHSTPGVSIRYTKDGSEPTASSSLYTTPVSVTATSTLKAKAFKDNSIPGETSVATYFLSEHAFTLPVISISTKPVYLWDDIIGIYTDGKNGIIANCTSTPMNWNQDWDRHATLEYFKSSGERNFDQSIDIRIGGACSRGNPQKSFAVKARDKYGSKTIDYKLFDVKDIDEYGGFMLRNSGNDFWYTMFRDAFLQTLPQEHMDIDYMAYQPTTFYLNGQYWGIQNLREKIDGDYIESNYGVSKDDLDLLEFGGEPIEGTSDAYDMYIDSLQKIDLTLPASFSFIDRHIDVQEFINYQTTEIYIANTDWPGNNIKFWRQRSTNGKFRWILWDTDFGFSLYNDESHGQTLHFATDPSGPGWPNPPWSTLHLRLLLQNPVFRARFVQTFMTAINTTFKPERVSAIVDVFANRIKAEMTYHKQRWGGDMNGWNYEVQRLRDFATVRNAFMQQYVPEFFGLNPENVTINVTSSPANLSAFEVNGITLDNTVSDLTYGKGLGIQVTPKPHNGYVFKSWKIKKRESTSVSMISKGDTWKYLDNNTTPAGWNTEAFNDNSWQQGPSELGYGDGDEATVVSYGVDAGNKYITTYLRKKFSIASVDGFQNATASVSFDDGVIVYLNGVEVFRNNLPGGTVDKSTLALEAAEPDFLAAFTIDKGLLKAGDNTIAVELHQSGNTSSDIGFNFEMRSARLGNEVELTSNEALFSDVANADITLEATFDQLTVISGIVINEFSAAGSEFTDEADEEEDWIELYNNTAAPVDLAGLYITDNLANKTKFKIPSGHSAETTIQPGTYKILWADEDLQQGPLHVNFKLSADGESVGLFQMAGQNTIAIDELSYQKHNENTSWARIPNVTGPFVVTAHLTPGSENQLLTTAIDETNGARISVYPNPTSGTITVSSDELISTIQICDLFGRSLGTITVNGYSKEFSMTDTNQGIYILKVKSRVGTSAVKIIKE